MSAKRTARTAAEPPPWKRKVPAGTERTTLSPGAKAKARKAAKQAGRRYPNLVDNMRAAAEQRRRRRSKKPVKA